jgi:hypothetical protein
VFVDGTGLDAPAGGSVLDAVVQHRPGAGAGVRDGRLIVTDSRGLPVPPDAALYNGAVLRLVPNRAHDAADPAAQFDA